ncbi:MAG: apolipoprotein N-acyltransferase [Candidatus Omnitrophica bacterium]|nr:apolipoprotein N-acyltransferase [Candidatus Omnitrophota bacterium]MDD5672218.1 apolipoprotein N-acyltransferase [Candidatus Omnitrophota bacterium]
MRPAKSLPKKIAVPRAWFAVLSGLILTFAMPHFPFGFLAWFALVPMFWAIDNAASGRSAVLYGLLTGAVFFGMSLHWLINVTFFGWIFVFVVLETPFLALFGGLAYFGRQIRIIFLRPLWFALAWSLSEWCRAEIPVFGFGWNLIAYTQASYPFMIQFADIFGAYGLGFLIVFVNGCLVEMLLALMRKKDKRGLDLRLWIYPVAIVGIITMLLSYGNFRIRRFEKVRQSLTVSLIQGNIPQNIKWESMAKDKIVEIYSTLTQLVRFDSPDLILWPEAAFPGFFNRDQEAVPIRELVRQIRIPLLIGSPHFENFDRVYNSAYLVDKTGQIVLRYDKLFLVPFGEYVPLKMIFGWLEAYAYAMGVSDFSSGSEYTVFPLKDNLKFSVLICFEDTFPDLARTFVNRGANFLAVLTNDAWFGKSSAPYQHLAASVFRALENGVPVIRAANTGVSAFISPKGIVLDRVKAKNGEDIFITGKATLTLPVQSRMTIYRQYGHWFPYFVVFVFMVLFVTRSRWTESGPESM